MKPIKSDAQNSLFFIHLSLLFVAFGAIAGAGWYLHRTFSVVPAFGRVGFAQKVKFLFDLFDIEAFRSALFQWSFIGAAAATALIVVFLAARAWKRRQRPDARAASQANPLRHPGIL